MRSWFTRDAKANIELPDGSTLTPQQVDAGFVQGNWNVSYSSGVHLASEFSSVIASYIPNISMPLITDAGQSFFKGFYDGFSPGNEWNTGLDYAPTHVDPQTGFEYRSYSCNPFAYSNAMGSPDGYVAAAYINYDFWKNSSGQYEFAITGAHWTYEHLSYGWPEVLASWTMGSVSRSVETVDEPVNFAQLYGPESPMGNEANGLLALQQPEAATQDYAASQLLSDWSSDGPSGLAVPDSALQESAGVRVSQDEFLPLLPSSDFGRPPLDTRINLGLVDTSMMLLPQLA